MMLWKVIPEVHVSWLPFDIKVRLFHSLTYPIKAHARGFGAVFLMVPLMIPSTVEFSVIILEASCGWPISFMVVLSPSDYLTL